MTSLSRSATELLVALASGGSRPALRDGSKRRVAVRGPQGAGIGVLTDELGAVPGMEHSEAAADVVVWVVDAAAPITGAELDEVQALANGGQSLVVAVNKIDVHPGWPDSLSATAALVEPIDASIPVVGVSALLAQLSRQTGTTVLQQSGFRASWPRSRPPNHSPVTGRWRS